jgi:hypothetical protein
MHFFGDSILTGIMTGASLGSLFDQSATSSTYEFGSSQNTRSNRLPIPVIYGRCKVAGNVVYESRPDPIAIKNETLSNPSGNKQNYLFAHGDIFLSPAPVIKLYRYYNLWGGRVQYNETVIVDSSQYSINEVNGELNFYQALVVPTSPNGGITQEVRADYTYQPATSGQIKIQVALGEGPVQSVSDIKINNVAIERIANASWSIYYGTSSQVADSRNPIGEAFRDVAYLSISLQANDQVSGTVTATAIVEGRIVNVWDSDAGAWIQTYSRNPVWCLLDMLTNTRYGKGIPTSKINLESFKAVAPYCDALVDNGNGGQESRFLFDYSFDSIIDSSDAIEEILKTFGGMLIRADGQIQLRVEQSEAATFAFDSTNIIEGSFTYQPRQRSKEIPNRVVIEFINPNNNRNAWEMDAVVIDDEWDQEQRGKIIEKKLQYRGITRASQAGRMGWLVYDKLRWCGAICQFRVGIDSIANTVGDVVTINHMLSGGVAKKFRILSMEEAENDEATITAMIHRDDIFHDRGVVYVPVPETSLPDPFSVPDPTGLVLSESTYLNNSGEVIPEITVEFSAASQYTFYYGTQIQISNDAGTTWQDVGTPIIGSYKIHGIQVGTSYQVRLRTISRGGIPSTGIIGNITLDGKVTPPALITSDAPVVYRGLRQISLTWSGSDDTDITYYVVERSEAIATWDEGNKQYIVPSSPEWSDWGVLIKIKGLSFTDPNVEYNKVYRYRYRARDNSNNYSSYSDASTPTAGSAEGIPEQTQAVDLSQHIAEALAENVAWYPSDIASKNTKTINYCETAFSANTWTGIAGTSGTNVTYVKTGNVSIYINSATNYGGASVVASLNLAVFGDGSVSTTDDYICFAVYISTVSLSYVSTGLLLRFFCDTKPTAINRFAYSIPKTSLSPDTWTMFAIPKTAFTIYGSPNWSNITGFDWVFEGAPSANAAFFVDAFQMVRRDPVEAKPNPFQTKINNTWVRLMDIRSGHWYVGAETASATQITCRNLNPSNDNMSLQSNYPFAGSWQIDGHSICKVANNIDGYGWYIDEDNYIQAYVDSGILYLVTCEGGIVSNVLASLSIIANDKVHFRLNRQGSSVTLLVVKNGQMATSKALTIETSLSLLENGYLGVISSTGKGFNMLLTAISRGVYAGAAGTAGSAEIASRAYLADVAVAADSLSSIATAAQFAMSRSANGYQKFPTGIIIQWGSGANQQPNILNVTFPTQFPTACFVVIPTVAVQQLVSIAAINLSQTGCQIYNGLSTGYWFAWMAIGW